MSAELMELSNALARATEVAAASTVAVHSEARGSASGVVWQTGVVVTAEHRLRRDEDISLTLSDGRVVAATLAGRDPSTDIAVLKCADAGLHTAQFGDASLLKPGSLALVVGRTRASGPVAGMAVVSLVASERRTWMETSLSPYVRLDIGLQPTAVGGAVTDAAGKTVGIATPRFGRMGAVAIPAPIVDRVVATLLQKGRIPSGYLGIGMQPIRLPEGLRKLLKEPQHTAAIVLEVEPGGPAEKGGLAIGDIVVTLGGRAIKRLEDVHAQLQGDAIGKSLQLGFARGGTLHETTVVIGERSHEGK